MWQYQNTDELYHHGIKGQKWGVQNGPPYPLGSHTSAMIKKGKKVAAKAKKTYDKKIKPKVNDLAKKGSDFYEKNMPEKGKQVINKAAKKTKEVYEVNKELAKKGISNYKSNYEKNKCSSIYPTGCFSFADLFFHFIFSFNFF